MNFKELLAQTKPLIAEFGQAHDGSIGILFSLIESAASSGADVAKFQMHYADDESSEYDSFRPGTKIKAGSRKDYWRSVEYDLGAWLEIRALVSDFQLMFACSPFSVKAVRDLEKIDCEIIKIGSGEVFSPSTLDAVVHSGLEIIASVGMSSYSETQQLIEYLESKNCSYSLCQCTSMYPTPVNKVGLNNINTLRNMASSAAIGYSDHSGDLDVAKIALALGADFSEHHVTFSRAMYGPDSIASLTFGEFQGLADFRDKLVKLASSPVDKDDIAHDLLETRFLFTKSPYLQKPVQKGDRLKYADIDLLKPCAGISEREYYIQIDRGSRFSRSMDKNEVITDKDLI